MGYDVTQRPYPYRWIKIGHWVAIQLMVGSNGMKEDQDKIR